MPHRRPEQLVEALLADQVAAHRVERAVRRSRWRAASACARMRVVSVLMTIATASMTANVTTYWVSETAKVK